MKKAVVCGAGGFIGSHLVKRLKHEGYWVRGVDLKLPLFSETKADEFIIGDLREKSICEQALQGVVDELYQLAADMGGAGYIFSGENDADIMHNSALINLKVLEVCVKNNIRNIFYSSSACIYPEHNQVDSNNPNCEESSAYPACPDSEYGWEKLFSERLYFSFARNYNLNVSVARFHNIFGEEGVFDGGREKAPAAFCRKVALAKNGGEIEMWGDGLQTRSFLYVDECIDGILNLMGSEFSGPVNIGSEEMVTINLLVEYLKEISGKHELRIKHIDGPLGVRGRNSDNRLIKEKLNWKPSRPLKFGLEKTYRWIESQIQ